MERYGIQSKLIKILVNPGLDPGIDVILHIIYFRLPHLLYFQYLANRWSWASTL